MKRIVEIGGDLPPTLNDQIREARTHYAISASTKKKWTNYVSAIASQYEPFDSTDVVWVEYHWYIKNFARDGDNIAAAVKFINDGLVNAGLIRKDNLVVIQSPVVHYYHRDSCDRFVARLSNDSGFLLENFLKQIAIKNN